MLKRRPFPILFLILGLVALMITAAQAGSIRNSKHDLTYLMKLPDKPFLDTWADYDQVCVYCHTPHNSLPGEQILWNRQMPADNYQLYRSESLISQPNSPGNHSLMCLSCHDGTIAVDSVINIPLTSPAGRVALWINPYYYQDYVDSGNDPSYQPLHGRMRSDRITSPDGLSDNAFRDCGVACHGGGMIAGGNSHTGAYMTQNMTDDHPVTIDYPNPLTWANRFKPIPANEIWPSGVRLYSNKVECGSCHDVHNPDKVPFLRATMDESALCFDCHNK